jgi:hypothetical protein
LRKVDLSSVDSVVVLLANDGKVVQAISAAVHGGDQVVDGQVLVGAADDASAVAIQGSLTLASGAGLVPGPIRR